MGTGSVSPTQSHSASPLPLVRGSPALRVPYGRVRLPPSPQHPSGWSIRFAYSVRMLPDQDGGGSPRFLTLPSPDVPCAQTPPQSPAVIATCDRLLLPSRYSTLSACGRRLTRLNRFTCVTARPSLCLRLAHVVTSISPRLDYRWGGCTPCRCGNLTRWKRQAWPGAPNTFKSSGNVGLTSSSASACRMSSFGKGKSDSRPAIDLRFSRSAPKAEMISTRIFGSIDRRNARRSNAVLTGAPPVDPRDSTATEERRKQTKSAGGASG